MYNVSNTEKCMQNALVIFNTTVIIGPSARALPVSPLSPEFSKLPLVPVWSLCGGTGGPQSPVMGAVIVVMDQGGGGEPGWRHG